MNQRIFNVLFISVFSAMLGMGIVVPLMPIYAQNMGATGIWLGMIFSGFSLSRLVFMPYVGKMSDRVGRKLFILVGLFIYSILSIAYILAYDVYTLTAVRFVHGFASAMVIPVALAYISEISPEGREGEHMGTFTISLFLGVGFGPLIGGVIKDTLGFNTVFYSMAILTAFAFFMCLLFLPDKRIQLENSVPFKWNVITQNRLIGSMFLFRFLYALGRGGIMSFLPILATDMYLSATQIGVVISMNVLLNAALQRPFGKLADRASKMLLISSGLLLSAVSLVAIPLAYDFFTLLALASLMGLGGALSIPAAMAIIAVEGRKYGHGSLMGLFNSAMSLGMIVGPLLSGWIMDIININFVFYTSGVVTFIGTGLLMGIQRGEYARIKSSIEGKAGTD
ncbi:MAG: MFS transporter [Archaeoglobaceae archaeon]